MKIIPNLLKLKYKELRKLNKKQNIKQKYQRLCPSCSKPGRCHGTIRQTKIGSNGNVSQLSIKPKVSNSEQVLTIKQNISKILSP